MADSELKLPGDFEAGKSYLLKGETLIEWRKALLADRVIAGEGIKEAGTPQGRVFKAGVGAGASVYHKINRLAVNCDGIVIFAEAEYWSMYFENGLLKWIWDSAESVDPEPVIPDGTVMFYSVNLTGP